MHSSLETTIGQSTVTFSAPTANCSGHYKVYIHKITCETSYGYTSFICRKYCGKWYRSTPYLLSQVKTSAAKRNTKNTYDCYCEHISYCIGMEIYSRILQVSVIMEASRHFRKSNNAAQDMCRSEF